MSSSSEVHNTNLKRFAIILLVCEVIIIVIYSIFVRINQEIGTSVNQAFYPFYQDVNVMMLIGFGFLMTFIKSHMWSALSYTFFINALVVQFYILLSQFWTRVFVRGFAQ